MVFKSSDVNVKVLVLWIVNIGLNDSLLHAVPVFAYC